jgi:hypothetical protein
MTRGAVVVRDSEIVDGLFPGQSIRYPVAATGRWVPLERESYLEELLRPEFTPDLGVGTQ